MNESRPAIYIYTKNAIPQLLKEIIAGIEEEGVLYHIEISSYNFLNVKALAYEAAQSSSLGVGIGIIETTAVLQLEKLSIENPIFVLNNKSEFRTLGTNAARLVKRQPFNQT